MKVCVLQPDYSQSVLPVNYMAEEDYKNSEPRRNLSYLLPKDQVDHVFLNKATTYRQLKELKNKGYDIFVNLCTACLDWDVPSIDVIVALEQLNLPYTGPNFDLYAPSKQLMKHIAQSVGVKTPAFVKVETLVDVEGICEQLQFPLFVKPASAMDSLGIDDHSYITTKTDLASKVARLLEQFDQVLIEEYVSGREYTVLLVADPDDRCSPTTYPSREFVFPKGERFKTYALKVQNPHPECNILCSNPELDSRLREAAKKIFLAANGVGYARLDFRVNEQDEIFFLEINFSPLIFLDGQEKTSADCVLESYENTSNFLRKIIAEGISRHKFRPKEFELYQNFSLSYDINRMTSREQGNVSLEKKLEGKFC